MAGVFLLVGGCSMPLVSISSPSSEGGGVDKFYYFDIDSLFPLVLLQAKVVGVGVGAFWRRFIVSISSPSSEGGGLLVCVVFGVSNSVSISSPSSEGGGTLNWLKTFSLLDGFH